MSDETNKGVYNAPGRKNDTNLTLEQADDIWGMLKSNPKYTNCPYCSHSGITYVERKANVLNLIFCICLGGFWWLYMMWFKKDPICWNADHKCFSCEKLIFDYKAC